MRGTHSHQEFRIAKLVCWYVSRSVDPEEDNLGVKVISLDSIGLLSCVVDFISQF
jgi:hypothetical protein